MMKWVWDMGYVNKTIKEIRATKVIIVSAFFSEYGLDIVSEIKSKNKLQKDNMIIYLSKEFTLSKPGELLEKLSEIATVQIVHRHKLHAKLFMFYTVDGLQVYHGSANFTRGGLQGNLELVQEISLTETKRLEEFVEYCHLASIKVDQNIIQQYKKISDDLGKYHKVNLDANRKISEIFTDSGDPFGKWNYEIDGYFFNFEDYETFFPKYQGLDDSIIRQRREKVRKKLLELNSKLKAEIASELNLHNHWASERNPDLITSQIKPSEYNHKQVSWICLRYGKHRNDALLGGARTENHESFIKNACMQVSVVAEGVQIGLFHATANEAIDRSFLKREIDFRRDAIHQEIANLRGENLVWQIYDPKLNKTIHSFNIDEDDPNSFVDFYRKYDTEGHESFCIYHMQPDNENLKTIENLARIAKGKMSKLHPLYKLITWSISNGR